ncbi:MAG: ATP-dependent helicase HrpB, partial [Acetobacteraceae bacterium]
HRAREIADPREMPDAMAAAIREALAGHEGDVLAFLPGWGEIRRVQERLSGIAAEVLPLHGDLPPAEQDRALSPGVRRRVVLSTPIAETSLTVPGVRIVVDSGFRRAPRLDPASGLARLVTVRISRAAADQRAGRAGRVAPGVAIRLWTEALHRGLPAADRPEILESELSGLLLDCLAWGAEPRALPFPDPPPEGALAAARALLADLDALDDAGRITATGRLMARMGAHPRLARLMLSARDEAERALAADLAALIEERDPIPAREAPADLALRLDLLAGGDHPGADRAAVARIRRTAALHRRRLSVPARADAHGDPAALLAAGFPDRIAARRGAMDGAFRLASGQGARLPATDPLAKAPLLAVALLDLQGTEARIRLAAPLSREALEARLPERFRRTEETFFDPRAGAVVSRARLRFGPLILEDAPLPAPDPEAAGRALARAAAERGFRDLCWTDAARSLQARTLRMRALEPDAWPDLSDAALAATAEAWLGPACHGRTRLAELSDLDVAGLLAALLPPGGRRRLDAELPARLAFPNGRDAPIDYAADPPRVSARAQWFYGMAALPALAGGRIPLAAELLSPAGRPIALTSDLAGFWRGGWQDARRDMRGRYPKHDWPEDPSR